MALSGLNRFQAAWRAYWLDWLQKLVNGENPTGKVTEGRLSARFRTKTAARRGELLTLADNDPYRG